MDNRERILGVVRKVAKNDALPDDPDESLFDSGFLDSFAIADLVSELEREFGIKFDSSVSWRKFESIARIQSYIESRM
jgi:acyl carrier protein